VITFVSLNQHACELFRRHGFQISKLGEEPIVKLNETAWKGKDYEWLRRQENYCQRQEIAFREVDPEAEGDDFLDRIVPELLAFRASRREAVHRCEMRFFVGQFRPWPSAAGGCS
jgi:phosphatidylglycerol lysyltransferase